MGPRVIAARNRTVRARPWLPRARRPGARSSLARRLRPPQRISEPACTDVCTKHLKNIAFLREHKGENSQGPLTIKIYNLSHVLCRRHLLVIFTWGGGGLNKRDVACVLCLMPPPSLCTASRQPRVSGPALAGYVGVCVSAKSHRRKSGRCLSDGSLYPPLRSALWHRVGWGGR